MNKENLKELSIMEMQDILSIYKFDGKDKVHTTLSLSAQAVDYVSFLMEQNQASKTSIIVDKLETVKIIRPTAELEEYKAYVLLVNGQMFNQATHQFHIDMKTNPTKAIAICSLACDKVIESLHEQTRDISLRPKTGVGSKPRKFQLATRGEKTDHNVRIPRALKDSITLQLLDSDDNQIMNFSNFVDLAILNPTVLLVDKQVENYKLNQFSSVVRNVNQICKSVNEHMREQKRDFGLVENLAHKLETIRDIAGALSATVRPTQD